jgi:hypothetical protein
LNLDDTSTQERKFEISNLRVFSICFKNLIRTPLNFDFGLLRNEINQWISSLIKALMKVISETITRGVIALSLKRNLVPRFTKEEAQGTMIYALTA